MNLSHYKISSWWVHTWDKYQVFLGKGSCRAPLNIIHEGSSGLSPLHCQQCLLNQSAGSSYGPETPGKTQLSATFWMCLRCILVNHMHFHPAYFFTQIHPLPPGTIISFPIWPTVDTSLPLDSDIPHVDLRHFILIGPQPSTHVYALG